MKNSDVIKALLLAAVNEIAANPGKYAVNPGRDFTRNRKMGFHDTLMMLLTMEATVSKKNFTVISAAPRRPHQRLLFTGSAGSLPALPSLTFCSPLTAGCKRTFTMGNTSSLPVTGLLPTSSAIRTMPTLSLNLTANLQGASTRFTSMPFIPSSTAGSPTSWSSLAGRGTNMPLSVRWLMLPPATAHPPYISPIWATLPTITLPMSLRTGSSSSSAAMTKGWVAYSGARPWGLRKWTAVRNAY